MSNYELVGKRVRGIVVENRLQFKGNLVMRPVIRFETLDGRTVEAMSVHGVAAIVPFYSKGTEVIVLYDPKNPQNFYIKSSNK